MKKILILIFQCMPIFLWAQNNTSSPLSMMGIGELETGYISENPSLNGIASRNKITSNFLNPAGLTVLDSTSFIFDVGTKLFFSKLPHENYNLGINANIDYFSTAFPIYKNKAFSFISLKPFSNVGYTISGANEVEGVDDEIEYTLIGTGGITSLNWGLGYKVTDFLSLGVTNTLLWGNVISEKEMDITFSTYSDFIEEYTYNYKGYICNVGLQLYKTLGKHSLSLGFLYNPYNILKNKSDFIFSAINTISSTSDTLYSYEEKKTNLQLPTIATIGLSYNYDSKIFCNTDCKFQNWQELSVSYDNIKLSNTIDIFSGIQYVPNNKSTNYFKRIKYNCAYSYQDYYYNISNIPGKKQVYSVGLTLPIKKASTMLSLNFEYVQKDFDSIFKENQYQFKLSYTLFDTWFLTKKID